MSTIKVDTITTRTGSGSITVSNNVASLTIAGTHTVNRTAGSDGDLIPLQKGGTTVGSIGTEGGYTKIMGGNGSVGSGLLYTNQVLSPRNAAGTTSDGVLTLGESSARFKDLYLSGGVYVGGTGSANHLDDYEEGTFTPTSAGSGLTSASGVYRKIGKLVHVGMKFTMPSSSSTSNNLISSLPFTVYNDNAARAGLVVSWNSGSSSLLGIDFLLTENTTNGIFYIDGSALTYQTLSAKTLYVGGTYPVA